MQRREVKETEIFQFAFQCKQSWKEKDIERETERKDCAEWGKESEVNSSQTEYTHHVFSP